MANELNQMKSQKGSCSLPALMKDYLVPF